MKNFLSCFLFVLSILVSLPAHSQSFIKNKSGEEASFRQMQADFNDWKKNHDLKSEKGWKYFKRWEMEMQLHTNGRGEPDGEKDYIQAALANAAAKEHFSMQKSNSASWYPAGPNVIPNNLTGYMENGIGRINCIAFHPSDANTYFTGVAQGGVWKTSDNGVTWMPLTDNLPITRISDILIDPNNPNTMYISVCDYEYIGIGLFMGRKRNTHYGLGIYKTTDGGMTWNPTGLTFQLTDGDASLIRKILIDPNNSNKLVACGVSGMYSSVNAGTTWTQVHDSLFWDMIQDPVSPNTLYAATGWVKNSDAGSAGIYKSTNFGSTWTLLTTGITPRGAEQRVKLAIAPSDNNYIYALTVDQQGGLYAIYKSTNAGTTWNMQFNSLNLLEYDQGFNPGGQGNYDLGFMVNPGNKNTVYVGGINLWMSTDGASSFEPASHWTLGYGPTIHADIHYLAYQPLTGNFFCCNDGGIYRTSSISSITWNDAVSGTPWPTQWTNIGNGMQTTSFYRISSSKSNSGEILAGAQDNGSFYFDGSSWHTIFGGDGMDGCIDTTMPGTLITSSQYGNIDYTNDGGFSFYGINANVNSENGEWTTPIVMDYNNYGTVYAGYENVVKSTDGGMTWSSISNFPPSPNFYNNELSALAVANTNPNVIYAARRVRYEYNNPGNVFKTTDGGVNWTDITAGLPDSLYYTSIEVSWVDVNTVYVTMAGFSNGNKVFMTTDGGTTWTNISYNLPNIPVNCIKSIPGTNDVMIATDLGVYLLVGSSTNWIFNSAGLPNVIVSDIEFNMTLNKIYVSTFGRGIWATDLDVFAGIKNVNASAPSFSLFPSANDGNFSLVSHAGKNLLIPAEIIDIKGRIVHRQDVNAEGETKFSLDLPSGLYFLKLSSQDVFEVKRFVIGN